MLEAVLFDLDDTLLGNDMETYLPAYFGALCRFGASRYDPALLSAALMQGAEAMAVNTDPRRTNQQVFFSVFADLIDEDVDDAIGFFDVFYRTRLETLQPLTQRRPAARPIVEHCISLGLKVVVATNPVFPMRAQQARLRWAGASADDLDYALVTAYEDMHAAKPNPAYYTEILERIGIGPQAALMIGNDWDHDIVPARAVGLRTYWISEDTPPDPAVSLVGHGSLDALWTDLQRGLLAGQ